MKSVMTGKEKCRMLKQLRKKIAEENGIEYEVENCKFKGNCKGTCPKCEADLKDLTERIALKRVRQGLTGLGVGSLALGLMGCTNVDGKGAIVDSPVEPTAIEQTEVSTLLGDVDVSLIDDTETEDLDVTDDNTISGDVVAVEPSDEDLETDGSILLGDVDVSPIEETEQEGLMDKLMRKFNLDEINPDNIQGGLTYEPAHSFENED